MTKEELQSKRATVSKALANPSIDDAKKKIFENALAKIDAELEGLKETPKEEKKEKVKSEKIEKLYTREECEKIIAESDERVEKAKISAKKSAAKSPLTKDKEKIEKVEDNIMERVKKGTASKKEILALIEKAKGLISLLQKALTKLK